MENLSLVDVESKIITLRNQQVILDCDVAELYGVQTKDVNKAVKNNPKKFPEGYIFQLDNKEKSEVVEIFHHLDKLRFSSQLPKAFTEKGLYMLATILKSPRAVETTLSIVETYAKLRELACTMAVIPEVENETEQKSLLQRSGKLIDEILSEHLPKQSSETSFELNLAMFKLKHSVRRENEKQISQMQQEIEELKKKVKA